MVLNAGRPANTVVVSGMVISLMLLALKLSASDQGELKVTLALFIATSYQVPALSPSVVEVPSRTFIPLDTPTASPVTPSVGIGPPQALALTFKLE
jgi:hypothetical protein